MRYALALVAGVLTVFGFAPFGLAGMPVLALALLFGAWRDVERPRTAGLIGFAFGVGLFGAGVSWVYIALETFGGMPALLAFVATAGFAAFLSLYPALAGWVAVRFTPPSSAMRSIAVASAFVLAEWLRGYLFTGFPWLAAGYAQLPESPLVGFAPIGGVWLVSLAVCVVAALLVQAIDAIERRHLRWVIGSVAAALVVCVAGAALRAVDWTTATGEPLAVSLVQGNIEQDVKFEPSFRDDTFSIYGALVERTRGRLIVLPESTFPMFVDDVPREVVANLSRIARARHGELLFGAFFVEPPQQGSDEPSVYNSVFAVGSDRPGLYRKRHLVPFGETIPAKPLVGWVMRNLLAIPIGDQARGPEMQVPFRVGDQRVAVNICYEDAFGDELRDGAREASFLVNVTNDAWYGRSIAARQHNQIAAMRALELGRPMLRATNTGITSAIDHRGRVIAELPWFTRDVLEVSVVGRQGETPYLRFGDAIPLAIAGLLLALAIAVGAGRR
ncbi:MAG TPA: apolipoprotein N-acyltransferase [Casimicrobiaceae bacterium]|nr:apolipoprotein N-acyltransferase [Casimicrobiaceae bacterium]